MTLTLLGELLQSGQGWNCLFGLNLYTPCFLNKRT
jgi:hypothetical protein